MDFGLVEDGVALFAGAEVVETSCCWNGGLLEEAATVDIGAVFLGEWPCEGSICGKFDTVLDCWIAIRIAL